MLCWVEPQLCASEEVRFNQGKGLWVVLRLHWTAESPRTFKNKTKQKNCLITVCRQGCEPVAGELVIKKKGNPNGGGQEGLGTEL